MAQKYWLMKSEPDVFSIDDLRADKTTEWEGVRNYQARNFMRDDMKKGDMVLYYHSNAKPPGVAGLATISKEAYPDPHQFDKKSKYYDEKSNPDDPRWILVELRFKEKWAELVSLDELKQQKSLDGMLVVKRGQRLSVQPVEKKHFDRVVKLGHSKGKVLSR